MPLPIDFYFDFSCPYAYLGSTQLEKIERETGAIVRLRPFLLGGVFRHLGQPQNMSTVLSAPKKHHNRADLLRWANWFEAPLRRPHQHPNRTVEALRCLLASPEDRRRDVMRSLYRAYWCDSEDIRDLVVLRRALDRLGLDGVKIVEEAQTQPIKEKLRACTAEAIDRGVFGAPSWVVGDQLFWGQDRIEMVKRATTGWNATHGVDFDFNQNS